MNNIASLIEFVKQIINLLFLVKANEVIEMHFPPKNETSLFFTLNCLLGLPSFCFLP